MKNNNDLFLLIKSLTKTEKRHFNLFASTHTGGKNSKLVKLYKAINKQEIYAEEKLKSQFEGQALSTELNVYKGLLYKLILKSLRNFHSGKTITLKIREELDYIELLYEKLLYNKCKEKINKIKKLIYQFDLNNFLPEIIEWEIKIFREVDERKDNIKIPKLLHENELIIAKLKELNAYNLLDTDIRNFADIYGDIRDVEKEKKLKQLLQSSLLKKNKNLAYTSLDRYLSIKSFIYYLLGDYNKAIKMNKQRLVAIEDNNKYIEVHSDKYVTTLRNQIILNMTTHNKKEAYHALKQHNIYFKKLHPPSISNREKRAYYNFIFGLEMPFLAKNKDFVALTNLIEKIKDPIELINKEKNRINKMFMLYNLATSFFLLKQYEQSTIYFEHLLCLPSKKSRADMQSMARTLLLFAHTELKNYRFLISLLEHYARFIKKGHTYKFETTILKFFKNNYDNIDNPKHMRSAYIELKKNLIHIFNNPLEANALNNFDLIDWLNKKI